MKNKRSNPVKRKVPPNVSADATPGTKIGEQLAARADKLRKAGVHVRRNRSHTYG